MALRVFGEVPGLDESLAWTALAATTGTAILTGGLSFMLVPASHKGTFYKPGTIAQWLDTWWWDEARYEEHNGNPVVEQTPIFF